MRYPKGWNADKTIFVSSDKIGGAERQFYVTQHVERPGKPDHGRRITSKMNRYDIVKLVKSLRSHLKLE